MRVLTIDDEPLAQTALGNILAARKDVESFDAANDAIAALQYIAKSEYDVLLLDINMPEMSGIELLDQLQRRGGTLPSVVFVTAHAEHAVAAFEKHAVDYVLKPFSSERINAALDAAARRAASERAANLMNILPQLQRLTSGQPARIAIKSNRTISFVDPREVVAVHAEGNYVLLQRESGTYLLRGSISSIAEKLKPYGFLRVHRSVLLNSSFVEEIRACASGDYEIRVRGGKKYTASRTYKNNLHSLANFWIGTESFQRR